MIKIDLITGFLGAGKTTFIKKYASYLIKQGKKIGILENDFGAVNVDMLLLQDLEGDNCSLEMIAGGCDADCHKRRFKTKLIAMAMSGYDRVIIEPSGIYDVDEFFDALYEEPLDRFYEPGNVIALVDAGLEQDLSKEAKYLLASEAADAGCVLFSKCDEVSEEQIKNTLSYLNQALEQVHCKRRFTLDQILCKNWKDLNEDDYKRLLTCEHRIEDYEKMPMEQDKVFDSLYYLNFSMDPDQLKRAVQKMFQDPSCGKLFRVKGYIKNNGKWGLEQDTGNGEENVWLELNATCKEFSLKPVPKGQEVLIVIGEKLSKERAALYLGRRPSTELS